jgi:mycothiol synthase
MFGVRTTAVLDGYTIRAPKLSDAAAILALATAYNTPLVGSADYTLDEVRDELAAPGFDRDRDGWVVWDQGGALAGYGYVYAGQGDRGMYHVDVVTLDGFVRRWLYDRMLDRAGQIARSRGRTEVELHQGLYRSDTALRELLDELGFGPATSFHRMRIDHDGSAAPAPVPSGVVLHEGSPDEASRRAAYEVMAEAFVGGFGHVHRTYDQWHEVRDARSNFDWSGMWVAELDGRAVGVCERTGDFVQEENCGYVWHLAVRPEARGRGIAKYLLRRAFEVDAAAGRTGTILHVDANNTTPALDLYESVGMRPVLVVDVWRRTLRVE